MKTGEVRRIQKFLKAARKNLDADMTVQRLQVLLEVALSEPIEQGTLVRRVDQTRSAVSKNVANWTALTAKKTKGPGFMESVMDPMNLTTRTIKLTSKGKAALEKTLMEAGV